MAKKTELEKGLEAFKRAAAEQGVNLDEKLLAASEYKEEDSREEKAAEVGELEILLKSLHFPHNTMMRKCKWCGRAFSTNYCYISYCSGPCRRAEFKEHFGVEWGAVKGATVLEHEPAVVFNADTMERVYELACKIKADYEKHSYENDQPQENPLRTKREVIRIGDDGHTVRTPEKDLRENLRRNSESSSTAPLSARQEFQNLFEEAMRRPPSPVEVQEDTPQILPQSSPPDEPEESDPFAHLVDF